MDEITSLMLQQALSQGLQDQGITDDIFQTEAVSNALGNVVTAINEARQATNNAINNLQQKASEVQSEAADLKNTTVQLDKIEDSMKEALQDKFGPATLPQQDLSAEEPEPSTEPQPDVPPAPDAGMMPPDQGMPAPGPDMGAMPPAPDAGMMPPPDMGAVPPAPGPDMMQISPEMIGAMQPRF